MAAPASYSVQELAEVSRWSLWSALLYDAGSPVLFFDFGLRHRDGKLNCNCIR